MSIFHMQCRDLFVTVRHTVNSEGEVKVYRRVNVSIIIMTNNCALKNLI